jgi:hypothetical protein
MVTLSGYKNMVSISYEFYECAISNENYFDRLYGVMVKQVSTVVCLFIWYRNAKLVKKNGGASGHFRYAIT